MYAAVKLTNTANPNHSARSFPIPGIPFGSTVMTAIGPFSNCSFLAGVDISFMSLQYGVMYSPGAGVAFPSASRTASLSPAAADDPHGDSAGPCGGSS
jgi:hypothetical protein